MLISIHVGHEYSFDASLLNRERIFQLENKRDDGIWEANFARPQLERFIAASPYIEAAAITNTCLLLLVLGYQPVRARRTELYGAGGTDHPGIY